MSMRKTNYTITVYMNTGFNGTDIPKVPSVLENAPKRTYPESYYLREDVDLPSVSINDSYHNLKDVDYVRLVPQTLQPGEPAAYYYFAVPEATAGGTTVLHLELDALLTMGGAANLDYISGWQERGHIAKADDELFANIAAEPWTPSQPLNNSEYQYVPHTEQSNIEHPSEDLQIIITNIDLIAIGKGDGINVTACGDVDPTTGQMTTTEMFVPEIQVSDESTLFLLLQSQAISSSSLRIPNTCAYDATNPTIKIGLKRLFSCGQLQLQGSYTLPKEYCIKRINGVEATTCTADGRYTQIAGSVEITSLDNLPFEYTVENYQVKNKKVFSTYRSYSLANISSGGTITKEAHLLKRGDATAPTVYIMSDPTSTGKPTAKFLSDLNANMPYVDVVNGSQWINNQILMEGASGSLWNSVNAAFSQQSINREMALNDINNTVATKQYEQQMDLIGLDKWKEDLATYGGAIAGGIGAIASGAAIAGATIAGTPISGAMVAGAGGSAMLAGQSGLKVSQLKTRQAIQRDQAALAYTSGKMQRVQNEARINQSINENAIGLYRSNRVVAPTAFFTPEPNLAMYGLNKFVVYETKKSDIDLISEDMFYQRYGYNGIHRPLTAQCFNCRNYYCYVQAFDVNIKSDTTSFGLRVRRKAIAQLNQGVRVWSVLPDASYYELN